MANEFGWPQDKTLRFAGFARFGDEVRVFHVYGPTPTLCDYDDVLAAFPNTRKGHKQAEEFAASHGMCARKEN